jgi:hypothetical protein
VVKRLGLGVVALIAVAALALQLQLTGATQPTPPPSTAVGAIASSSATASPALGALQASPSSAESSPSVGPSTSPVAPGPLAAVPIVPVAQFRSPADSTNLAEVRATMAGAGRYHAVELVGSDANAVLAALEVARPPASSRFVLAPNAAALAADLAQHRDRLGFLRADEVGPSVRALGWAGVDLFGVDRIRRTGAWPLTAQLPRTLPGVPAFDPRRTWTMVAGGDILLDRGVYKAVEIEGKGVDFPFSGGVTDITSRYCCSSFGWNLPIAKRVGAAGAVRHLLKSADIAVANFENPAPDAFRYHTHGTVFSADPDLIAGLAHAGIDVVSIANNHIGDAGSTGIIETRKNLAANGIKSAGAGANLAQARQPAILSAGGIKVAILGYDTIAHVYGATATKAGSAQLSPRVVRADVAAARRAGADLVIVYPHWGTEYDPTPFAGQRALAHSIIDAGADIVIGNHAHWAGAMEIYKGRPIWYALGNFVFDQTWSEPTEEGITLEMTFRGKTLVQVRMHPHLILDGAQPNLLDPAGDGRVVLGQVFGASKGMLPW